MAETLLAAIGLLGSLTFAVSICWLAAHRGPPDDWSDM